MTSVFESIALLSIRLLFPKGALWRLKRSPLVASTLKTKVVVLEVSDIPPKRLEVELIKDRDLI
jgi:hypothetical protein